jgi:hypothetical protein
VLVGSVRVPVLEIVDMIGLVSVLFVSVSLPASVARVPVVGRVTEVVLLSVRVRPYAPEVVRDPARVRSPARFMVRSALFRSKLSVRSAEKAPSEDAKIRSFDPLSVTDRVAAPVIVGEVIVGEVSVLLVNVWVADVPTSVCEASVGNDRVMLDEGLPAERIVAFPACLREIELPSSSKVPAILMPYASERKPGGRNPPTKVMQS